MLAISQLNRLKNYTTGGMSPRFGYARLVRRNEEELVRAILVLRVWGRQDRGRPHLTWEQVIWADIIACGTEKTLPQDRNSWKTAIRQPEPGTGGIRAWVDWLIGLSSGAMWKSMLVSSAELMQADQLGTGPWKNVLQAEGKIVWDNREASSAWW